jgi:DNA-binding NarL/FixJ family response regulator
MIHLVIAGGHAIGRRGVRMLLEAESDIAIAGEAALGTVAVELACSLQPEVVVVDASLRHPGVLEVARLVHMEVRSTEILILSNHFDPHLLGDAFATGARGFVFAGDGPEDLVAGVRSLALHTPFVSPTARAYLKTPANRSLGDLSNGKRTLTSRERLIVRLIAEGLRTPEIAGSLGISEKTVETHRASIFRKLECDTLADVVHYAVRNQLVEL